MNGLPPLDPANPTAVMVGIEATKLEVKNPVAKVTDPLILDVAFQVGGTLALNFKNLPTPANYTINIYYESIGALGAGDEGAWGPAITGDSSQGVDVSVPPATGVLFDYKKNAQSLPAIAGMTAGTYKLSMTVTFLGVPFLGDVYAFLEGPILRRT